MVQSDLSGLRLRSLPHSPWAILQNQAYRPPQALAGAKHRYTVCKTDPLHSYWFFKARYQLFGNQLSLISLKYMPESAANVDELLLLKADIYTPYL